MTVLGPGLMTVLGPGLMTVPGIIDIFRELLTFSGNY